MEQIKITDLPKDPEDLIELYESKAKNYKMEYPNFMVLSNAEKKQIFVEFLVNVINDIKTNEGIVVLDYDAPLSYYRSEEFVNDLQFVLVAANYAFREVMSYLPDFKIDFLKLSRLIHDKMFTKDNVNFVLSFVSNFPEQAEIAIYNLTEVSATLSVLNYFYSAKEVVDLVKNKKIRV